MDLNARESTRRMATYSVTNTKSNHKRKRASIPRRTRRFQLRLNSPQDIHVAQILDYARSERREVTMIRDAVQLQHSLERGDISLLLERFPWIVEALKPPAPPDDGLRDEIRELKRMMLEQGGNTIQPQTLVMKSSGVGLSAAPVAVVTQAAAVSADEIASNFLSMFD